MTRDPLNIGVRLTPELHAALSAEVSRRTSADPDAGWSLSSVARSILRGALLGRAAVPLDVTELRPVDGHPVEAPRARAELQPVEAPPKGEALDNRRQPPTTATRGPCAVCGEGLWHPCARGCGRRVRTCGCEVSIRADGVCASCAQTPPAVDLTLAPPKAPKARGPRKLIAPDDVQESARVEVRAWLGAVEGRTKVSIAAAVGTAGANVLRWLAPGVLQRLPADTITAVLAHVRANP